MKERPILMKSPVVLSTLDGSKNQTRRMNGLENANAMPGLFTDQPKIITEKGHVFAEWVIDDGGIQRISRYKCPYGQVGDQLWVRETWGVVSHAWDENENLVDWVPDRHAMEIRELKFGKGYYSGHVIYAADGSFEWNAGDDPTIETRSCWKPSILMPRLASRIQLEITGIRVERLNDISEADAEKEGIEVIEHNCYRNYLVDKDWIYDGKNQWHYHALEDPVMSYASLWDFINGDGSWAANPWVFVIEFKVIKP